METLYTDIAILGGGASGLLCAAQVGKNYLKKHKDIKITILEKQQRVGKKLLSTGNGKCNLTNINADISNYYGSFTMGVNYLLKEYSPNKVVNFFDKIGLKTTTDNCGRVYPLCKQASAVLDVLRFELNRLNVQEICDFNITNLSIHNGGFKLTSDNLTVVCNKLVVATGSKAYPKLGGNASGLDFLKNLGHTIVKSSPGLCPVKVKEDIIKSLKGIRADGKVTLKTKSGEILREERGEIQFGDTALSGICVFNVAQFVKSDDMIISLSLLPDYSEFEIDEMMKKRIKLFYNDSIENLFTGLFHKRIGQALLKCCNIAPLSRTVSTLNNIEINKLCKIINNWIFTTKKSDDFNNAQIATGGVFGKEINPNSLESKLVKNLFICGEAIDVHGDCGGFNLQFAFSSGMAVGDNL